MRRRVQGPRRARSVESYLRHTRVIALLALLAVMGAVISDLISDRFWGRHALLAGLVSSVIVVVLSIAVINEVLERRSRQRWSILAQYVMFELIRNARMIWSGVLEATGLFRTIGNQQASVDAGAELVRDTSALKAALQGALDGPDSRARLREEIALLAEHSDEVLGRWAAVMLNAAQYAEVLDRHVELVGAITWIAGLFDSSDPPDDARRQRRARSNPAIQIWTGLSGEWLADRVVVMTQLAEALDRETLELALRLVPVQWWEARLAT